MCSIHVPHCSLSTTTIKEFKCTDSIQCRLFGLCAVVKGTLSYRNLSLSDERNWPFLPSCLSISAPGLCNH